MQNKGNDWEWEGKGQELFAEIIMAESTVKSGLINVDENAEFEVESGVSAVVVGDDEKGGKKDNKPKNIIFPLLVKPENDDENKWSKDYYWAAKQGKNQATFNSNRGIRKHAARDLYTNPYETVVSIANGTVLNISSFYDRTDQVTILHKLTDGREFIIRYGELDPTSITVKAGIK